MSNLSSRLSAFILALFVGAFFCTSSLAAGSKGNYVPWTGTPSPGMVKRANFMAPTYIYSLAWTPDGERLAVGVKGSIFIYSTQGQLLDTYPVSPATLHPDATPQQPDQNTGNYTVTGLWWSPDAKSLAGQVYGEGIPVWNTETDQLRFVLKDHEGGTLCLAWAPKSDALATGGEDTLITLYNATTGKPTKTLDSHMFPVRQLAYGKTDDEIVSLGIRAEHGPENTEIKHWSIEKALPITEILQDYGCTYSALSPQGDFCSLVPYPPTRGRVSYMPSHALLCDTVTGHTTSTPFMPHEKLGVRHFFSPSGNAFVVYFCNGGISKRGVRSPEGGPLSYYEGSQVYTTKGAQPLMAFYNSPKSLLPITQLPASSAAISKTGMLATSQGKSIQLWAPPF